MVAGSTGEGSSLSDDEKLNLFACVAEAVTVPVLAGTTFANTQQSVALTSPGEGDRRGGRARDDPGLRAAEPGRHRRTPRRHRREHAARVMLYDIPSRTGRKIASSTTIKLVRNHPNIIALKDASGDLASAAHTKAVLGDALDLYSGDDAMTLAFMAIGAVGVVSVAAHWAGPEVAGMTHAAARGDWETARR